MQRQKFYSFFITIVLLTGSAWAQEPAKKAKNQVAASAPTGPVTGSGTPGRIAAWSGVSGSSTYVLTDSNIYTDKFGKIGIGTTEPTSPLTVQGMIETTLGGYKFPDGTVQTTATVSGLLTVSHNATLTGDGTAASPLGVKVPLLLSGSVASPSNILQVRNTGTGVGIEASGGAGGSGVLGFGGENNGNGGLGVQGFGGKGNFGNGGVGVQGIGGTGNSAGKKGGTAILGIAGSGTGGATPGLAGDFVGNVAITGTLSKGAGSFKIDHPLDPENKYLYHSFVESPDMMNIYNGNIVTDETGEAVVTLPDYFEALNRDFRYQLTVIGTFAQAIVAEKIKGNQFHIKTNAPNVEVSWQVTGVRHDAFANKNRIPVEEAKDNKERGYYLYPEAFNQPEEKSVTWATDPEGMKQRRQAVEQMRKRQPNQ